MSAELLRRAASLMRERAEAARPGPYTADAAPEMWNNPIVCGPEYPAEEEGRTHRFVIAECHGFSKPANAAHIASWHPAVALAVADWLDACADYIELAMAGHPGWKAAVHHAETIARDYLGSDA